MVKAFDCEITRVGQLRFNPVIYYQRSSVDHAGSSTECHAGLYISS